MSQEDVVLTTLTEFGRLTGARKKGSYWYWNSPEVIVVLNLQKSMYSARYYINVGLRLFAGGEVAKPTLTDCHLQTRIGTLLEADATPEAVKELAALLDLDAPVEDEHRHERLSHILAAELWPMIEAVIAPAGIRSTAGQLLIQASLITGDGQRALASIDKRLLSSRRRGGEPGTRTPSAERRGGSSV